MTIPTNAPPLPIVAELPTCQNTLDASAQSVRILSMSEPVTSVDGIWKIHVALGSPPPPPVVVDREARPSSRPLRDLSVNHARGKNVYLSVINARILPPGH